MAVFVVALGTQRPNVREFRITSETFHVAFPSRIVHLQNLDWAQLNQIGEYKGTTRRQLPPNILSYRLCTMGDFPVPADLRTGVASFIRSFRNETSRRTYSRMRYRVGHCQSRPRNLYPYWRKAQLSPSCLGRRSSSQQPPEVISTGGLPG